MVEITGHAIRAPRAFADGDLIDLGRHRLRLHTTPHVPHGWDAQVLFEETTQTLLCGDLFTQTGQPPALVEGTDLVSPALEAQDMFRDVCLTPDTAPTLRRLADLDPP